VKLPFAGLDSEITGGVVSIVNVFAELNPVFPARSDCSAWAVYVPSDSEAEACTEYEPLDCTGADNV
jgi:hypothetical protein